MVRRRISTPRSVAADAMQAFVGNTGKKKPPRYATKKQIEAALADITRRLEDEDWDDVNPQTFVALYCWCHEKTYDVPADLRGKAWNMACIAAANMLRSEFGGNVDAMLAFMRWTWQRERRYEQFRRQNQTHGKVLSHHDQFKPGKLLTEYRIDQKRKLGG